MLATALEAIQFRVTTAANARKALHLIDREPFDVLLSDLHMAGAGDGYTVVSAMRHKNPAHIAMCACTRQNPPLTRLFDTDAHRGIAHPASQHLSYLTKQSRERQFQLVVNRRDDDCRRMRFPTQTNGHQLLRERSHLAALNH